MIDRPCKAGAIALSMRSAYTIVFILALVVSISHHEIWRDEIQAWLIARESESLLSLLRNMDYEGHPPLWYVVIWLFESLISSIHVLQIANIAFAAAAVWYLLRLECVPRMFRFLWPFTYVIFYEYGTIARNYAIGIACLTLALFFAFEKRRAAAAYLCLALASLTSVYSAAIAGAIGASWLLFDIGGARQQTRDVSLRDALGGRYGLMALLSITIIISGLVALPPADSILQPNTRITADGAGKMAAMFLKGVFLTPEVGAWHWSGPHLLDSLAIDSALQGWLALAFIAGVAILARHSVVLLAYWLMVAGGLVAVGLISDRFDEWRHIGQATVAFTVWYAMDCYLRPTASPRKIRSTAVAAIVTVFLISNLLGTIPAVVAEVKHTFSYGSVVARYIRGRYDPNNTLLLGYEDSRVSVVHAFAPQYPFIYLNSGLPGGYVRWGKERDYGLMSQRHIILAAVERGCASPDERQRILISHMDPYGEWGHGYLWVDEETTARYSVKSIAKFVGSLSGDEDLFLYEIKCP